MKKIGKRLLSIALAAQMLLSSTGYALAAETPAVPPADVPIETATEPAVKATEPYGKVYYNTGYGQYAGVAGEHRLLAEGIEERESGSSWSWLANDEGLHTLETIKDNFSANLVGRVPDRTFAGWTVYTGDENEDRTDKFTDLWEEKAKVLVPTAGILKGDFDEVVSPVNVGGGTEGVAIWKGTDKLPLVGRWVLSNKADILPTATLAPEGAAPAVTGFSAATEESGCDRLYDEDITGMSMDELTNVKPVDFPTDKKEYWLRVTTETDMLDLAVIAPEPYVYDSATKAELDKLAALPDDKKPGVHVSVTDAKGKTTVVPFSTLNANKVVLNDSDRIGESQGWENKQNSAKFPARSLWTATGLGLEQSGGAGHYSNDVTVTVVAPDGETTVEYVFHIQRLGEPTLSAKPGNTPYGMIARDSGIKVADKPAARTTFVAQERRFGGTCVPSGAENNSGAIYQGGYGANAWAGATDFDPDLDETAIVVYQDSAFTIPGFTVVDSAGNTVAGSKYGSTVGYQLGLRLVDKLEWGNAVGTPGTTNYYNGANLTTTVATPEVTAIDGTIAVDLHEARVAPGIYSLEYQFADPVSGKPYTSDPGDFIDVNKGNAAGFARTLIVLPLPGDVDMNGVVTMADALAMETMLAQGSAFMQAVAVKDPTACLFAYRVYDVDEDGAFTQKDITEIWSGYSPNVRVGVGKSNYFYLPLNSVAPERTAPATPTGTKPVLTLDYLGPTPAETGTDLDDALESGAVLAKTVDYGEGLKVGDVFWVGIRLSVPKDYTVPDDSALKLGISAAAMSIAYDSSLVKPVGLGVGVGALDWQATLTKYNMRLDDKGVYTNYMWGRDYFMVAEGSDQAGSYGPQVDPISGAKAKIPLEATAGAEIKELRVALSQTGDVRRVLAGKEDTILFRVPFEVIAHPHNETEMQALELALGPRELALAGLASPSNQLLSTIWDNGGGTVFGGASGNLAEELEYGGGTALTIKLGEDKTEYTVLENTLDDKKTVYGAAFSAETNTTGMTEAEQENLPKGLTYTATGVDAGYIKGIPAETGTFTFYVGTAPYMLTVEKTVLDLTVAPQKAYYGEALPVLTFTYNKDQIKALDKSGGGNYNNNFDCTGAGSELSYLEGYKSAPVIRSMVALSGDTIVAQGTSVGGYYITLTGGENKNYEYRYARSGYGDESDFTGGYNKMEILPRPIVVEKLLKDEVTPIATILYDALITKFQKTASYKDKEFSVRRGGKTGETSYNGLPLTGDGVYGSDELVVSYQAEYIKDSSKGDGAVFKLAAETEPRDMRITDFALTEHGGANANYVLVDPKLATPIAKNAGIVVDRPATKLEIVKGIGMVYGNGAGLNLAGMSIRITYGHEPDTRVVPLTYERKTSFTGNNVQVTWEEKLDVTAPTPGHDVMETTEEGTNITKYFALSASAHSGRYLCVWVPTSTVSGSEQRYIKAVVSERLSVAKTELILTVSRMGRYYGEGNPKIPFTYNPTKLSVEDYNEIKAKLGREPTGNGDELEHLTGYVAPKISVQLGLDNKTPVDAATPAVADRYLSVISRGDPPDPDDPDSEPQSGTPNNDFLFTKEGKVNSEDTTGYHRFDIYPRPIVVSEVIMANGGTDSDYFLYDDTAETQLVTLTYKTPEGTEKRKPTATTAGTDKGGALVDRFTAARPTGTTYFPAGGSGAPVDLRPGYTLTGSAVVNNDALSLTYQANYKADQNTTAPFFTLTAGTERRTADIRSMALIPSETASNYVLVYDTNTAASYGIPTEETAQGTVKMRAMEKIEITLGNSFYTSYTYGDPLSLSGTSLKVTFETAGDNAPEKNDSFKNVEFLSYMEGGNIVGDSFDDLGLSVGWMPRGAEAQGDDAVLAWLQEPKWSAANGSYPTAVNHSGRQLAVYGRRYKGTTDDQGHKIVFAETVIEDGMTIGKKKLPLTVTAQNRYYSEPNSTYEFTFQAKDLAEPDSKLLAGKTLSGTATAIGTAATSEALTLLGGYTGPQFDTAVVPTTSVGTHELDLSGGMLDNYTFSYTPATIRIFRRPIVIEKITKSNVYTIYYNNIQTDFSTNVSASEFRAILPAASYRNADDPEYEKVMGIKALPLTGDAVRSTDVRISLNLTAIFPEFGVEGGKREPIPDGQTGVSQPITIANLALATGAGNYMLVYNSTAHKETKRPVNNTATARLDKRNIKSIQVVSVPQSVYTYGDTLDISDLQIEITYEFKEGETPPVEIVRADSRDGIYVNYYNSATIPAESEWKNVPTRYRPAANGDHLTIAPDHDTTYANFGKANEKYLIISATADTTLGFAQPVIVPASVDREGNNPVGSYQIKVNPLPLTYTLGASDKTYDGDKKAVGTLALTNAYNRGGVADVVYATTGATYEKNSVNYRDYTEFLSHVASNGYHFSTGNYNSTTGELTYTGGSYGDGASKLTYAFVNPNVNYRDARDNQVKNPDSARWDSYGDLTTRVVEVSGIKLGGADAANYSINTNVLESTVAAPGRPAAPIATVQKAYRAAPLPAPELEADLHTNAVKVSMEKVATDYNPLVADDFAREIHYEYRLEGWDATGVVTPNTATQTPGSGNYQDQAFFGGEPIEILPPEGYEPSKEPEPPKEGDIVKGQLYRWAEEDALFGLDENGQPLRAALRRNQLLRAQVRLAETHNFFASDATPSVSDDGLAAAAATANTAAAAAAAALVERAEGNMQHDKENPEAYAEPAPMVKTYVQRLTVTSPAEEQGKDTQRYTVVTLESVWFTDVLEYTRKEVLNSVTDNFDPTRYHRFFWDVDKSGEVKFENDAPLNLGEELQVEIREKQPDNSTEEKTITVNPAEPLLGGHSALFYVNTQAENGAVNIRKLEVTPATLTAKAGDKPVQIAVKIIPSYAASKKLTWSSSDEKVATVSQDGLVSFVAPGVATITVTATRGGATASVEVTVTNGTEKVQGVFDLGYEKPFLTMTPDGAFLPERTMTRGELVTMLSRFYVDSPSWTRTGSGDFPDLKGTEYYAPAAKLLGDKGIITGISGGLFAAENTATRAEMAVILVRMMGLEIVNTKGQPHAFSDAGERDTWAYAYIDALAKQGIIKGTGGGKFNPNGILTRAEAACMIARILEWEQGLAEEAPVKPIDVPPNHWGYSEIIQAVNGRTIAPQKK